MNTKTVKGIIHKHKFRYIKAILLKSFTELMNIAIAFSFGLLIQGASFKNNDQLKIGIISSMIILISMPFFEYISNMVVSRLNQDVMYSIRQNIIESYINTEPEKFRAMDNGAKISILTNDIDALYSDFLVNIFWIWHFLFMLVATVISLLFISIYMSLVLIILTIISFYFSTRGVGNIEEKNQERLAALSEHTNAINELISGYDVIHDFKLQEYSRKKISNLFKNSIQKYMNYRKFVLRQESIGMFFGGIVFMGGFIAGSVFVYYSILSLGMLITCIQLSNNLNQPIFNLVSLLTQFRASKNTIMKIDTVIAENIGKKEELNIQDVKEYNLRLDNISYKYPNSDFVLGPLNGRINYGKKICILGHSGSGKSTILKLLKKDIQAENGNMQIGDIGYSNIGINQILDYIGVISQNVFVFKNSIKNNITLFEDGIQDETVVRAMKLSGLDSFIDRLNDGDFINEFGNNLSGGERQRLAIARCIVRNKPIIIADEAFSSLDNKLAYEIENELLNIKQNTFINITHRLFIKNLVKYDEIWILDKGKLVAKGHYDDIKNNEHLLKFLINT